MHLQREREEVARREDSVSKREQIMAQLEAEHSDRNHEVNHLREQVALILAELKRCNIQLECLQSQDLTQEESEDISRCKKEPTQQLEKSSFRARTCKSAPKVVASLIS